jgi:surface antigen
VKIARLALTRGGVFDTMFGARVKNRAIMTISKFKKLGVSKFKRSHLKVSSLAVYAGMLFVLVALVMSSYRPPSVDAENSATNTVADQSVAPVATVEYVTTPDEVKSAALAASAASSADLSVANSVYNQSVSISTGADLAQYDATTVSKAQITDPTVSIDTLTTYTAVAGDTASSIAEKFGVSAQTVRWANNLTNDTVAVGSTVVVPVLDGVVYTVKAGDDLDAIATKYKSNVDSIVTVNDLDNTDAIADVKLLLPNGVLPDNEKPGYKASVVRRTSSSGGTIISASASWSGNKYAYGYCTWYVYNRRAQIGRPVPSNLGNANTWANRARGMGYTVDHSPAVGAVMQNGGGLGHVAVVESINPNGSIVVSEMNAHYGIDFDGHQSGWGKISHRIVYNPASYTFIH